MRIVCVPCRLEFLPQKNGVSALEMASFGRYKLWQADKWECPGCHAEILAGFGGTPVREHFQPDFDEVVASFGGEQSTYEFYGSVEEMKKRNWTLQLQPKEVAS